MSTTEPVLKPPIAQTGAELQSVAFRLEHLVDEAPPSVPCDMTASGDYAPDTTTVREPGDRDDAAA